MTAKEKAKELVCNMYGCEINTDLNDIYIFFSEGYFLAEYSALIAVDEIIKETDTYYDTIIASERKLYWQQVKTEINNL